MLVTHDDVTWVTEKLNTSPHASLKRLYLRLSSHCRPVRTGMTSHEPGHTRPPSAPELADVSVEEDADPLYLMQTPTWTLAKALAAMRVIALDERTMWECMSLRFCDTVEEVIDTWNEQLAVKLVYQFLQQRPAAGETDSLLCELVEHARVHIKPREKVAVSAMSLSASAPMCGGADDAHKHLVTPSPSAARVGDTPGNRSTPTGHNSDTHSSAAESSSSSSHNEGEANSSAKSSSSSISSRNGDTKDNDHDDIDAHSRDKPPAMSHLCGAVGVLPKCASDAYSEGALLCTRPVAPFGELLRVPRSLLFFRDTVLHHCDLARALCRVPTLRSAVVDSEEVLLVLCLIYEMHLVGAASSHWSQLLLSCPLRYPSMPAFWRAADLAELEGTDMVEEVLAKRQQVDEFCADLPDVLALLYPELPAEMRARYSRSALRHVYGSATVRWARATFDSRAFNLHVDGRTVLALVPWADMINHSTRSDVLVRRVCACDSRLDVGEHSESIVVHEEAETADEETANRNDGRDGRCDEMSTASASSGAHVVRDEKTKTYESSGSEGDFVMCVGAGLTEAEGDVDRELWMSYGPLQNWELLQFYGFVLTEENEHDKLPFPFQPPQTSATSSARLCEASDDDDDAEENGTAAMTDSEGQVRASIVSHYGLFHLQRCWIGFHGEPSEALRALLRVYLADAASLRRMYYPQWHDVSTGEGEAVPPPPPPALTPFDALAPETERAVVRTVEMTVQCVLDQFSTTLDEDEQLLREMEAELSVDSEDSDRNMILCLRLRVALKRIAHRAMAWCAAQTF